jgi:hypothetical protein
LKKQNHELQKSYTNLEYDYNESNEKYQELYNLKQTMEKDVQTQRSIIEQERNAKLLGLEKIQELEGRSHYSNSSLIIPIRKMQYHDN